MSRLNYILTGNNAISVVLLPEGKSFSINPGHVNYGLIKKALLKGSVEDFLAAVDVPTAVATHSEGLVTIRDGNVYFNGEVLHNAISDRILSLMRDGFPFKPVMLFLNNLMRNPSKRAVDELYKFLSHRDLTITEDGCFLGYKRVKDDYTDYRTGKVNNRIGQKPSMPRNMVDDNWHLECSSGFHVGSIAYVRGFYAGQGHVMIVKVNPAEVVSVPPGEETKLRTCEYEVVGEYDDKDLNEPMPDTLHSASGQPLTGMGGYGVNAADDEDEDDDSEWDSSPEDDLDDEDDSDLEEDDDDDDSNLEDAGPIED